MCNDTAPDMQSSAATNAGEDTYLGEKDASSPDPLRALYPLLLIDAGNSRIKWEFRAHHTAPPVRNTLPTEWLQAQDVVVEASPTAELLRMGPAVDREAGRLATLRAWQTLTSPKSIWISNVAGADVASSLSAWLSTQWPCVEVHTIQAMAAQCGVTNHYLTPERLGSDRWAGMIGARAAYPSEALLIATLGTATTLDAMNADGHFVGGLIAPGWSLMMRALGEHTAQLPVLSLEDALSKTHPTPFAQATPDAIAQGCKLAQVGLITQAWQQWQHTLGTPVRCVLAGGAATEIGPGLAIPHTRNDHLVLDGLAHIATHR